ncbi:hypothetical protein HDU99_008206, partial [Rhizoclosmatium hyalinum]
TLQSSIFRKRQQSPFLYDWTVIGIDLMNTVILIAALSTTNFEVYGAQELCFV